MPQRKPDYILRAAEKTSSEGKKTHWSRIGAAWVNENGIVSITLDPFVVLSGRDRQNIILAPNDGEKNE